MRRRLKNWVIYYGARGLLTLLSWLPSRLRPRCAALLGAVAHAVARFERATARRQLGDCLGLDGEEGSRRLNTLVRGVFRHLALSVLEVAFLLRRSPSDLGVELDSGSALALERALENKRGVVFVTGHLGNWELMAAHLAMAGYPIWTVAKESYDGRFTRLQERARGFFGVRSIYRGRPGSAAAMLRVLRRGEVLGVLIDQDTRVPGTFVPFFGKPAFTPVGAAVLAERTGAALVVGTVRRVRPFEHKIEIEAVVPRETVEETTAALTACLEERIRQHPSQWVWFHRRWKTQPHEGGA